MKKFYFFFLICLSAFAQSEDIAYSGYKFEINKESNAETTIPYNPLANEGINPNTVTNPRFLINKRYIIHKDFFTKLFEDMNSSGVRINFGLDKDGQIYLILNAVKGQNLTDLENIPVYYAETSSLYGFLKSNSVAFSDINECNTLINNFKNSELGYVHSYFIGKEKFKSLVATNKNYLNIKIAVKKISNSSIKHMLYLVLCDTNTTSDNFTNKYNTSFNFTLSFDPQIIEGAPVGNGNSKPCPPFGCNE